MMPISFTPISAGRAWHGSMWTVNDELELARLLARVAIGQATVVEKILHETGCTPPGMATGGLQGARSLLTVRPDEEPAHRDGWIFQVISWIAAHLHTKSTPQRVLIRPPQMKRAQSGQDGLIIEYSDDNIAQVVICEDKATKNPRQQFHSRVLPEFDEYETGSRDNELIAGVTAILNCHGVEQADDVVASILWNDQRAYRIAVTVGQSHGTTTAQTRIFRGYEQSVRGDIGRRRVGLLPLDSLRSWFSSLADKALGILDQHDV